jgi:hypothetical protein
MSAPDPFEWAGPETDHDDVPPKPIAEPYVYRHSSELPPRPWQYPGTYLRQYLTVTSAPGGGGKTSLAMVEAVAIALGKPLLDAVPFESGPVLIFNGEDPREEIELRLAAIVEQHGPRHGFTGKDLEGRVFIASGRDNDWVVIKQGASGLITEPRADEIETFIREKRIIHVMIDPFISTHEVSENDNPAINAAATLWVNIAHRTNSAMHLNHHAKKTNGAEVTEDSSRGAKALVDKARVTRFLQPMTEQQAEMFGIDPNDRFGFVRINDGKVNLRPRTGAATWVRLVGVVLGNGETVQTVIPWKPPSHLSGVTVEALVEVQRRVKEAVEADKPLRRDNRSGDYVGHVVADVLGLDRDAKPTKPKVKSLVNTWFKNGALVDRQWFDKRAGRSVSTVDVGEMAVAREEAFA